VIDLHCHLLPAIDDGPPDLPAALALARAHVASRVTTVAVTPHVMPRTPTTAAQVTAGVAALEDELARADIPLALRTGGEVDLAWASVLSDEELSALSLGGAGWILLEAPLRQGTGVAGAITQVMARGHRVLLAHPERSPALQRDPKALGALVRGGVRLQVTATALTGSFGTPVERYSRALVDEGLVHVVASDAHDDLRRPPGLVAEIAAAGLDAHLRAWTMDVPAAILAGEAVPERVGPAPDRPRRRGLWRR
jgi:protein-tyrosine phosphatase